MCVCVCVCVSMSMSMCVCVCVCVCECEGKEVCEKLSQCLHSTYLLCVRSS